MLEDPGELPTDDAVLHLAEDVLADESNFRHSWYGKPLTGAAEAALYLRQIERIYDRQRRIHDHAAPILVFVDENLEWDTNLWGSEAYPPR